MKAVLLFSVFLGFLNISAQETALKKIKERYYQVNADNYQTHIVELNTMQAAIGLQTTQLVFYYYSWQTDAEESAYELDYQLVKIEVSYNIAASMDYKIEYLFDDNEELIFYLKKVAGEWENSALRYYLDKNKLIKVISKGTNEEGKTIDYTSIKNFKQDDINSIKLCILNSTNYLNFFNELIKVEKLDK